jgi:hypothetical protein
MNHSAKLMVCKLTTGGLGFVSAFAIVRWLVSDEPGPGTTSRAPSEPAAVQVEVSALRAAGEYTAMESNAKLDFSLRLQGLSAERRDGFLQECLQRENPERTALLSLLLLDWAASSPAEACEWALHHLEGVARKRCLGDLFDTWAARDGDELALWYNNLVTKENQDSVELRKFDITLSLSQHSPVSLGRFAEMECNRHSVMTGFDFDRSLRSPEAVQYIGSQLIGHVGYIEDLTRLKDALSMMSSGRNAPDSKWGWNELFEKTAVAWHQMDPNGCDAWLSTWPENAQIVARHFIDQAESKPAAALSLSPGPHPSERPPPAAPDPNALDKSRSDWTEWWRGDAAAAEAFLNAARWPEDLKFQARAKAYSSPP